MIAGFIAPTAGAIRLGGNDITRQPPWKRNTGLVFQSCALFPHLSVVDNVAFGLRMRKLPQSEIAVKLTEAVRLVRLEGLADRLPRELSGARIFSTDAWKYRVSSAAKAAWGFAATKALRPVGGRWPSDPSACRLPQLGSTGPTTASREPSSSHRISAASWNIMCA